MLSVTQRKSLFFVYNDQLIKYINSNKQRIGESCVVVTRQMFYIISFNLYLWWWWSSGIASPSYRLSENFWVIASLVLLKQHKYFIASIPDFIDTRQCYYDTYFYGTPGTHTLYIIFNILFVQHEPRSDKVYTNTK